VGPRAGVGVGIGAPDATLVVVEAGVRAAPTTRSPPPPHAVTTTANPAANPHVALRDIRPFMVASLLRIEVATDSRAAKTLLAWRARRVHPMRDGGAAEIWVTTKYGSSPPTLLDRRVARRIPYTYSAKRYTYTTD